VEQEPRQVRADKARPSRHQKPLVSTLHHLLGWLESCGAGF
jgi:hypothetical protein